MSIRAAMPSRKNTTWPDQAAMGAGIIPAKPRDREKEYTDQKTAPKKMLKPIPIGTPLLIGTTKATGMDRIVKMREMAAADAF